MFPEDENELPPEAPPANPAAPPTSAGPNLFSLYDSSLEELDEVAKLYENPVMDNPADFSSYGAGDPWEFYDDTQGEPQSAMRGPGAMGQGMGAPGGRSQNKAEMANMLQLKAQERKEASAAFQANTQKLNGSPKY